GLSINSTTGLISGTIGATADSSSPYVVTVTGSDGASTDSQTFSWTVSHVLLVNPGDQTNTDGDAVSIPLSARDNDHEALTYTVTGLPAGLSANAATGLISGTVGATADTGSPYAVTVTASDGTHSGSQAFNWYITPHIYLTAPANQANGVGDSVSLAVSAV